MNTYKNIINIHWTNAKVFKAIIENIFNCKEVVL